MAYDLISYLYNHIKLYLGINLDKMYRTFNLKIFFILIQLIPILELADDLIHL